MAKVHQTHPDIVKRLRRAEGHLRSIVAMMQRGDDCLDLAQQMHAVEKAVNKAKVTLIQDHIDHCLERAAGPMSPGRRQQLDEFKTITKYL
jgi:hypothetical protein NreA